MTPDTMPSFAPALMLLALLLAAAWGALPGVDVDLRVLPGADHRLLQPCAGNEDFIADGFGFANKLAQVSRAFADLLGHGLKLRRTFPPMLIPAESIDLRGRWPFPRGRRRSPAPS